MGVKVADELTQTEYLAAQLGYLGFMVNPNSTLSCLLISFISKVDKTVLTIELETSSTKLIRLLLPLMEV